MVLLVQTGDTETFHLRSFSSSGAFSFSSEKITVVAFCFLVFPVQGQDQTDGGDLY